MPHAPTIEQDSIPVGCVPPACQPYAFQWLPLDVSTSMGVIGPKVNKFEQVSSDDHQMSVAVGVGLTSGIRAVGGTHVTWRPPQTECQIDTCENLIFMQPRLQEIITQNYPPTTEDCVSRYVLYFRRCALRERTHGSGMNCVAR